MSEPRFNISSGFSGGVSVSVRADTTEELEHHLEALRQKASTSPLVAGLFKPLLDVELGQAVTTVQASFPQATPPFQPAVSTVGAVAQPQAVAQPPLVGDGGSCLHGPRVYNDKPVNGKPWRRYECAIPWSPQTKDQRCKHVNA